MRQGLIDTTTIGQVVPAPADTWELMSCSTNTDKMLTFGNTDALNIAVPVILRSLLKE